MKLSIESKVATGFILSLLIIGLFSINTYFNMHSLIRENKKHYQTQLILKSVNEIRTRLIQIESAGRNFALTGSKVSDKQYQLNNTNVIVLLNSLNRLLVNEKGSQKALREIDDMYIKFVSFENKIIETKQNKGTDAALTLLLTGKSAEYGNRIINSLQQIENIQRSSIIGFTQANINAANITIKSFLLLVIIMIIILGMIYYLFKVDMVDRKKAKYALCQMNENLENTVRSRTQTLINSEKKYRLLADNVIDVISLHQSDGTYTYVSESSKNILGYDPQELIGRTGFDFMHPDDIENIKNIHSNLVASRQYPDVIPFRFLNKDGVYIWVESLAKVVTDTNGNFEGIVICTRDISERVKAEVAFKEHQRMLQSILDNTSNPIFIKKIDGEYLLANKEFENFLTQINADLSLGVQGRKMEDVLPSEFLLQESQRDTKIIESSEISEFELQYQFENETKAYSVTKFPMYDDNNEIYAICGIGTNITSYKKAQKAILDSKAQIHALIQNSIDPVWAIDKDFKLTDFNRSCKSMISFFYGIDIYMQMDALQMGDDASSREWERNYKKSLSGKYFSKEVKVVHNLEDHYYDVSFNPIIVNDNVEGVAVFARDVTSHKETEKQLKYKVNELNTFMYKATHDLRSPLVSLMGLVDLAQRENDISEIKQYFSMIGKSVVKMDKLLVDLVNITNVSQGKLMVNKVNFNKIVSDIIDSLGHYPNFENIEIRKNIDESVEFYNDDKLLYSVMQNLIDNAIKYSRKTNTVSPVVTITVESGEQFATINISDNGIGIPTRSKEKVFDMFYRATTESSGTGLGLYIVKSAVEKMKGKIALSSKENSGTSMYITLPNFKDEKELMPVLELAM